MKLEINLRILETMVYEKWALCQLVVDFPTLPYRKAELIAKIQPNPVVAAGCEIYARNDRRWPTISDCFRAKRIAADELVRNHLGNAAKRIVECPA